MRKKADDGSLIPPGKFIPFYEVGGVPLGETLWENDSPHASCDHGFASHVVRLFHRDVAGIYAVDAVAKKIAIRLPKLDRLAWASAVQPVPGGAIKIRWEKQDGKLAYTLETPAGYDVAVENASGLEAVRR